MTSVRTRRVGHKGAAEIEHGNTTASFDAALSFGVDMIEFDVLSARPDGTGELYVAHDYEDLASRGPLTFAEALDHLTDARFDEVEFDVDIKLPGYETRVLEMLRERELVDRVLVSGMFPDGLAAMRAAQPGLRVGWSVPRVKRDYTERRATRLPAYAALVAYRAALPRRVGRAIRAGRCDAIMANWRVVTPALLASVRRAGGELFVWTVDDAARIQSLEALGVDGIITNDPRLFS
ncbi:MAG TPA: glycerophosphodiester phosphodiesterase [Solirubrobacteraceae bacterium]|nr:glycerophosphodiester phosphodiesterase [Solirubrobacteraceae bacterium]